MQDDVENSSVRPDTAKRARIPGRDLAIFALVAFALAGLTRLLVLPLSVIDWDESVYLLMSRDILHGVFPYQGGFDHKPVGLYYTFALAQLVFGQGVLAIRLLAIAAVGLTSFLIALFLRRSTAADTPTAAGAGALYALLSTLNGGLATNTEILLNVYAVAGLILLNGGGIRERFAPRQAAFAGIVLGLMLNTNYIGSVIIAGLGTAYAVAVVKRNGPGRGAALCAKNGLVAVAAALAVAVLLLLPIALWSDLGDYVARQVSYLGAYRQETPLFEYLRRSFRALVNYAPLVALAATALLLTGFSPSFRRAAAPSDIVAADQTFVYLAFALLTCVVSGRVFPHYFILVLPSLCLIAGQFLERIPAAKALRAACTVWLLLVSGACLAIERWDFRPGWEGAGKWLAGEPPDTPAKIARDLRGLLKPDDLIYVYDYEIVLYELLDTPLPMQHFFPPHHLWASYRMDRGAEIDRVMAKKPRFVIAGGDPHAGSFGAASAHLSRAIDRDYTLLRGYRHPGRSIIQVFERRPAMAGTAPAR